MKRKSANLLIVLFLAISITLQASMVIGVKGVEGEATIWTDKADYSPEETVTIYGTNFLPNTAIVVNVTRPDGHVDSSLDQGADVVYKVTLTYLESGTTDEYGNFTATYQLDGIEGLYSVTATDGTNTAETTFTDYVLSSVSVSPSTRVVKPGSSTTYTVTAYRGGTGSPYSVSVTLSLLGSLPTGAGSSFSVNPVTIGSGITSATSTLTITTDAATPEGIIDLQVRGTPSSGSTRDSFTFTLQVRKHAPIGDSRVEEYNPNANYGTDLYLDVEARYSGRRRRSYLKFDLSDVPNSATITSATLHLHRANGDHPLDVGAYQTSDFYAGTTTPWAETGITWNNAPAPGTFIIGGTSEGGDWYGWSVTSYVASEVAGDDVLSVVLKYLETSSIDLTFFLSRESESCPWLEISYTVGPTGSKLVFSTGAGQTLATDTGSSAIAVQRQDASDNPVSTGAPAITVTLSTTSAGGAFYSDSACTTVITSIGIAADASTSDSFYYKDTNAGSPTLTGHSGSLTDATTTFTIVAPVAITFKISGAGTLAGTDTIFTIDGTTYTYSQLYPQLALDDSGEDSTGSGSMSISLATTHSGDLLYVSVVQGSPSGVDVTSSPSLTWSNRASVSFDGGSRHLATYYAVWSGSGTITIDIETDGSNAVAVAFAVSGVDTVSPFDGSAATNTGSSTSPSVTKATSNANDFIIGALGVDNAPTISFGDYNEIETISYSNREVSAEYQTVSSTGSYAVSFGLSSSQSWGIVADAVKQASGITFYWIPGSGHTVTAATPLTDGSTFDDWTNGDGLSGAGPGTYTTPGSATTVTANYVVGGDTAPPDTSISSGPTGWIKTDSAGFTWTGSDDVTSTANLVYSWRLDAGAWSAYSSATSTTLNSLTEGSHTFEVRAKDEAENVDPTPATRSFSVDTVAPDTTDNYDGLWHTSAFTITLSPTDATSGVSETYYKINGGVTESISVDGQPQITTEGATNSLEYWSVDVAGNEETPHNTLNNIKLDLTNPSVSITTPSSSGLWFTSSSVDFAGTASAGGSPLTKVEYQVDGTGGSWSSATGTASWSFTATGLTEGTHTVYVRVTADSGRTDTDSIVVGVDTSDPTVAITSPNDGAYFNVGTVAVSGTASDGAGVSKVEVKVDASSYADATDTSLGGDWSTWSFTTGSLAVGTHTITARVTDMGGHTATDSIDVIVGATSLTFTSTVWEGQYSDPVTVSAKLVDLATDDPIQGKTITFEINTVTKLSATDATDSLGIAEVTITLDRKSGTYTITASFAGDTSYQKSSISHGFAIKKEDVTFTYLGDTNAMTALGATSAPMQLVAHLDQTDSNLGDLGLAKVEFKLDNEGSGGDVIVHDVAVDASTGNAITSVNVPIGTYTIIMQIEGSNEYWTGYLSDSLLNVIQGTGSKMVTGGGFIQDGWSINDKGNFGFTVNYQKNGAPKGQFVYLWKGDDGYNYKIKSNSWQDGGLTFKDAKHAYFIGRCTVTKIERSTGIETTLGNYRFRVDIFDGDLMSPRQPDTFALTIWNPANSAIYRQIGTSTLVGGNIVIHSK